MLLFLVIFISKGIEKIVWKIWAEVNTVLKQEQLVFGVQKKGSKRLTWAYRKPCLVNNKKNVTRSSIFGD